MFHFGFHVYRFVGIIFGLFTFRNFLKILLPSVFISTNFRQMPLLFVFMTCRLSGWTLVVEISIWCVAISAISFFWSFLRSRSVFSCTCQLVYGFIFDFFWVDISAFGAVCLFCFSYRTSSVVFVGLFSVRSNSFLSTVCPVTSCR